MLLADERVLVVDDDAGLRSLIALICRRAGFQVDTAADGNAALKLMSEHRYLLVTLDLQMPHTNGFDVITRLSQTRPRPAIIVITAMPPATYMGLDPGVVQAVVRKPFDVDLLTGIVSEVAASAFAQAQVEEDDQEPESNVVPFPC